MRKIIISLLILVFSLSIGMAESKKKELEAKEKGATLVLTYLNKLLKEGGNRALTATELKEVARLAKIDQRRRQIAQALIQSLTQPDLEQFKEERIKVEDLLWELENKAIEMEMHQWFTHSQRMAELEQMQTSILFTFLYPWPQEYLVRPKAIDYLWLYLLLRRK